MCIRVVIHWRCKNELLTAHVGDWCSPNEGIGQKFCLVGRSESRLRRTGEVLSKLFTTIRTHPIQVPTHPWEYPSQPC